MAAKSRNPKWQRDELILALDLYFKQNPSHIDASHVEVKKLSDILNSLPIHADRPDEERFRNPNGVYMKLCNFLRFDPTYHGVGLRRGGKLEQEIWNEFASNPTHLRRVAQSIIESVDITVKRSAITDEEESNFPEGKVLYRQHRYRERNRRLVLKAKEIASQNGQLKCQVCGFDFLKKYGEIGEGFIECHHTIPVSDYIVKATTNIKDLAFVCSNCHRMLHRRRPWLTINDLSDLIRK